jgi:hypothetical protein
VVRAAELLGEHVVGHGIVLGVRPFIGLAALLLAEDGDQVVASRKAAASRTDRVSGP